MQNYFTFFAKFTFYKYVFTTYENLSSSPINKARNNMNYVSLENILNDKKLFNFKTLDNTKLKTTNILFYIRDAFV